MALYGSMAGLKSGERLVYGTIALAAGVASVVVPKLDPGEVIKTAECNLNSGVAPGISTQVVTFTYSGMTLSIFGWMPTSAVNTTMIATTGTQNVEYWIIVGRQ